MAVGRFFQDHMDNWCNLFHSLFQFMKDTTRNSWFNKLFQLRTSFKHIRWSKTLGWCKNDDEAYASQWCSQNARTKHDRVARRCAQFYCWGSFTPGMKSYLTKSWYEISMHLKSTHGHLLDIMNLCWYRRRKRRANFVTSYWNSCDCLWLPTPTSEWSR